MEFPKQKLMADLFEAYSEYLPPLLCDLKLNHVAVGAAWIDAMERGEKARMEEWLFDFFAPRHWVRWGEVRDELNAKGKEREVMRKKTKRRIEQSEQAKRGESGFRLRLTGSQRNSSRPSRLPPLSSPSLVPTSLHQLIPSFDPRLSGHCLCSLSITTIFSIQCPTVNVLSIVVSYVTPSSLLYLRDHECQYL